MATGARLAVAGYIELGQWLLDHWGDHFEKIAAQIDTGTVTVDAVVQDTAECAMLSAQSVVYTLTEAVDAVSLLRDTQDQPNVVPSVSFPVDRNLIGPGQRFLRLAGPLAAALGSDTIPETSVQIVPSELGANDTGFSLTVDATDHPAGLYTGAVRVLDANATELTSIAVWVGT
jgi:hypothetical protein